MSGTPKKALFQESLVMQKYQVIIVFLADCDSNSNPDFSVLRKQHLNTSYLIYYSTINSIIVSLMMLHDTHKAIVDQLTSFIDVLYVCTIVYVLQLLPLRGVEIGQQLTLILQNLPEESVKNELFTGQRWRYGIL